jgi:hypothetical protein
MRTDELRTLLHEHGEEVHDRGVSARLDAVHGRVARARRRRAAAAGGGLVAAVVAVALVVVPGMREPQAPVADHRPSVDGYSKDGITFPQQVRDRELLGANVGDPGQSPVYLTADGTDTPADLRISPVCYGPHADEYAVSVSVEDVMVYGMSCGAERPADPVAAGTSSGPELRDALRGLGSSEGSTMEVRVWLRPRDMRDSEPVTDPEMVVGVGVYGVAGAEGPTPPDVVEHRGRTWKLDAVAEVGPGEDVLGIKAGRADQKVLVVEAHSGLGLSARYEVLVDRQYVGGARLTRGNWIADGLEGDSTEPWSVVDVLEPGDRREVLLHVVRGSTRRTRLALAEYHPVD